MRIKTPKWLLIFLILFASGCVKAVPGQAGSDNRIRILVFKDAPSLEVRSAGGTFDIKKDPSGVKVNGKPKKLPLRFSPKGEFIYLNGRPYRGTVEVLEDRTRILVVNELSLEKYLVGIINNEISSRWPSEVIKTQVVIARTYALFHKNRRAKAPYDIESSVMGQVYNGVGKEDPACFKAVDDTRGEILTYGGEPALTVYHSNAGGMTESSRDVWSKDYPYLVGVESPYDSSAPRFVWDFAISADSLKTALNKAGYKVGEPAEVLPEEITESGRIKALRIIDTDKKAVRITGEELRKALGYSTIKSTFFEVAAEGGVFVFKGKGSGHGVGLSQWGAKGMADNGAGYREILEHFYPGTELEKAY